MSNSWPAEYLDELHEDLSNALLEELTRLKSPQHVFELFYGIDFIYVYQREKMYGGKSLSGLEKDLTSFIQSSINALVSSKTSRDSEQFTHAVPTNNATKNELKVSLEAKTNLSPEIETLCLEWVNRPTIPSQKLQDFLEVRQGKNDLPDFISTTTFKRALQLMGRAARIQKGSTGRWETS
jgi:hypothetical protein